MDNLTKIVRTEISRQYKSVRQFSFAVDIPLSTINSALHNGIGGSSFDTGGTDLQDARYQGAV